MIRVGINAQIVTFRAGYRQAGVSRFTAQMVRALQERDTGARYSVFVNETARGGFTDSSNMRFHYTRLPAGKPVVRILWEQMVLPVLAARLDVLHCPVNVLPVAAPCPAVLTIHDLTFLRYPERFRAERQRYLATLTRFSARRARRIMTDSANTKRDVAELFGVPPDRIEVVYPGLDDVFHPFEAAEIAEFRGRKGLPEEFLLYVGTLEPRKNVPLLLRAYRLLLARGLERWPLIIGGGRGWMFDDIYREVEQGGLSDHVRFAGYIDPAELPYWYAAATAFVYPSLYEGFGLPALEAMACGTPVVVSNTSSLPEVVGDAGLQVDPTSVDELADALGEVLESKARREQMSAEGLRQAASFTWEKAATQLTDIYRQASR
ncbi:MAG TPA: glycosyltransferase family 1 protein [Chloroflexota bacterium]|nr:glycosyltransferase family 1 protein [Chloroflexota bacterium]